MLSPASTNHDSLSSGGQLAFLRRITDDDEFRARLESDPQAALAEYGLQVDPSEVPAKVEIPTKEAVRNGIADLEDSSLGAIPIRWVGFFCS